MSVRWLVSNGSETFISCVPRHLIGSSPRRCCVIGGRSSAGRALNSYLKLESTCFVLHTHTRHTYSVPQGAHTFKRLRKTANSEVPIGQSPRTTRWPLLLFVALCSAAMSSPSRSPRRPGCSWRVGRGRSASTLSQRSIETCPRRALGDETA